MLFFSYSRRVEVVRELVPHLQALGHPEIWIDDRKLPDLARLDSEIEHAIRKAAGFFAAITPEYLRLTSYCRIELECALAHKKPIATVIYEDVTRLTMGERKFGEYSISQTAPLVSMPDEMKRPKIARALRVAGLLEPRFDRLADQAEESPLNTSMVYPRFTVLEKMSDRERIKADYELQAAQARGAAGLTTISRALLLLFLGDARVSRRQADAAASQVPQTGFSLYVKALADLNFWASIENGKLGSISIRDAQQVDATLKTAVELGFDKDLCRVLRAAIAFENFESNGIAHAPTCLELLRSVDFGASDTEEVARLQAFLARTAPQFTRRFVRN